MYRCIDVFISLKVLLGTCMYLISFVVTGLGIHHSIGHADFYPSGGHSQPHCNGFMSKTLSDIASGDFTSKSVS